MQKNTYIHNFFAKNFNIKLRYWQLSSKSCVPSSAWRICKQDVYNPNQLVVDWELSDICLPTIDRQSGSVKTYNVGHKSRDRFSHSFLENARNTMKLKKIEGLTSSLRSRLNIHVGHGAMHLFNWHSFTSLVRYPDWKEIETTMWPAIAHKYSVNCIHNTCVWAGEWRIQLKKVICSDRRSSSMFKAVHRSRQHSSL